MATPRVVACFLALVVPLSARGCGAFHHGAPQPSPRSGTRIERHASSTSTIDAAPKTTPTKVVESELPTTGRTKQGKPSGSKFAALMAGEASSPPGGFEPLTWDDAVGGGAVRTAVLPDDDVPRGNSVDVPSLHHQRTLYYHPSLLTASEATSLQRAAERSGRFHEHDSRCATIIEDGAYRSDDDIDRGPSLAALLHPLLEEKITPWARATTGVPTLAVADALIRSYDPAEARQDLAVHYDVTAYATVIVPLNDPMEYEGGLFVQTGASADTRRGVPFVSPGDAVLHRFDVMHGVNVRSGRKRCSLVVWFGEDSASATSQAVPWVKREAEQGKSVHAAFLHGLNAQYGRYGVEQDVHVAKECFRWGAERGHALSAYCLSLLLFREASTADVSGEKQRALQSDSLRLLQLAAERGLAPAQHDLGIAYKQGYRGLRSEFEVARSWLTRAARQGHGPSSEVLGDPSRWMID